MLAKSDKPWSFTIVFDEEKAARNGYDIDQLYDYVGKNVEPLGNVRVGRNTWQAKSKETEFLAQLPALAKLSEKRWVMENVKSWTSYEDDEPEGHDYLQVIREVSPYLICG